MSASRLPKVGLCGGCAHAQHQRSARGSTFLRCRRADEDPSYPRYPPLPVEACRGYEPGDAPDPGPQRTRPDP